jgi:hypothetical protein
VESHPFILIVEPHLIFDNRYRWIIFKDRMTHKVSDVSFGSSDEAKAKGEEAMRDLINIWRATAPCAR